MTAWQSKKLYHIFMQFVKTNLWGKLHKKGFLKLCKTEKIFSLFYTKKQRKVCEKRWKFFSVLHKKIKKSLWKVLNFIFSFMYKNQYDFLYNMPIDKLTDLWSGQHFTTLKRQSLKVTLTMSLMTRLTMSLMSLMSLMTLSLMSLIKWEWLSKCH